MKMSLAFALLALTATPSLGQMAGNAPFRQMVGLGNPAATSQWADVINDMSDVPQGVVAPSVFVLEGLDRFGRRVTFTQIQALYTCGASNCRSRLFIDGKVDKEQAACSNPDMIDLSSDGSYVVACGERIEFSKP